MIENPQPIWLMFLLIALPGVALSARALNAAVFPTTASLSTVPPIFILISLLPTHFLSLAFGSLSLGLASAWTIIGAYGYFWSIRNWSFRPVAFAPEKKFKFIIAIISTLPIVFPTIILNFHDEVDFAGHQAIIAHIQNGFYPPRYLYEPSLILRYHYAFDLAASITAGLFRVRPDQAIDILTLILWPTMFLLLWRVGNQIAGERVGLFVALAICYSGGLPIDCTPLNLVMTTEWQKNVAQIIGYCKAGNIPPGPPFISNYFQHPWSIAFPIFALIILLVLEFRRENRMLTLLIIIAALCLLSLCQAILFVSTVSALFVSETYRFFRYRRPESGSLICASTVAVLSAKLAGGFFLSWPSSTGSLSIFHEFLFHKYASTASVLEQFHWNITTFGLLLLVGPIGLAYVKKERLFICALFLLPFFIVNTIEYRYTWDIVKFAAVASISLAIGAGIVLCQLWQWARTMGGKAIFAAITAVLTGQGVTFPFIVFPVQAPIDQMIRPYLSLHYPIDNDNAAAINYLRVHVEPKEIVFRSEKLSKAYAVWGGLPTWNSVWGGFSEKGALRAKLNDGYGLGTSKYLTRKNLSQISSTWLNRLSSQNVKWIVADSGDAAINEFLRAPANARRVQMVAQYGSVRVFRVIGDK